MTKKIMKMVPLLVCVCFIFSLITGQPLLAKGKKEILIGTHNPLTGFGAQLGLEQKWSYAQAVADINKEGGIYVKEYDKKLKVRLITIDDESDPAKAAEATEQLIKKEKVDLILSGQVGAMGTLPAMIVAERYQKYYHGTVIWVPQFLEQNFKWATMYFFDPGQGAAMIFEVWNSLDKKDRPQRPAILVEDSFDGKTMSEGMTALGEKFGYEFVLRLSMVMGGKDFNEQVRKAKAAKADAIFCFANTPETIALVRQMKENDLSVKVFQGMKGTWAPEFVEALGKDSDYIVYDAFWSEDYPFKGAKDLGKRYTKEFEQQAVGAGMYYAVCQTLFQAIEKAGTLDGAKVRQAVLDNKFETVNGPVDYDERGIALFPLGDGQWLNGKRRSIYPFDLAKYKLKIAPPWDKR
jgi:branched-chain amino acid transport system substrate-binding protein